MGSKDYKRIKTLFQEAVRLAGKDRDTYLDKACKGDPDLRARVEALLKADTRTDTFLEQPALSGMPHPKDREESIDFSIGPYRLKRVISSGGMGIVYEALQERPKRTVAIKVMKEGFATQEALHRFEYESEILARLNHPNIAQIVESGTHRKDDDSPALAGTGVPYFVMEYIEEALPITDYVREKNLATRERIELFLQVCDAVHYGHQKGVIHRDLKPSNILVNAQGQVKIIDFGVARASGREGTDTLVRTEVGQLIGTVQYMSPEQCKADPNDLDTRSDVYSLAVVLYEMLLESPPYDVETSVLLEALRVIQEEPPQRPGTMNRKFRGDLETLLLKALEKERRRRYQNVMDLSQDLERFLRGEVILAKPAGPARRLAKWMKRNPVLSATLGVSLLSFVVFILYVLLWYNPAIRAERDKATAVSEFLVEMIESPNPSAEGIDVKVVDILDLAARRMDRAFPEQPGVKSKLHSTLGWTYMTLGQYESAEAQLREAMEIYTRLYGPEHWDTLRVRVNMIDVLQEQYRHAEAEALGKELIPLCRSILGAENLITLMAMENLGICHFNQRHLKEAAQLLGEVLAIRRRAYGEENKHTLATMRNYGLVLREQGAYEEAEAITRKSLDTARRTLGEEHANTLGALQSLANLFLFQGKFGEAEEAERELLEIYERVLGEEHPLTLGLVENLVSTLNQACRYEEAEALGKELVETVGRTHGKNHKFYLEVLQNYSVVLKNLNRLEEAETHMRWLMEKRAAMEDPEVLKQLEIMFNLAMVMKLQGKYPESEELNRSVLQERRLLLGENHRDTLVSINNLANVLGRQGKFSEAEAFHREALEKQRRILGENHPDTLNSLYNLSRMVRKQERLDEAEILFRETVKAMTEVLGRKHTNTLIAMAGWAMTLEELERFAEAEPVFKEVWALRIRIYGKEHRFTVATAEHLVTVLAALGKWSEAEPIYLELHAHYLRQRGEDHERTLDMIRRIILLYEAWGREEEAEKWRAKLGEE